MPYVKVIPIRSATAFLKLATYLSNPAHPNHVDYDIEPLRCLQSNLSVTEFLQKALTAVEKIQPRHGGRRIKNIAALHIIRTADGTDLSLAEREQYARDYINSEAPDGNVMQCWHVNRVLKCEDLNILVPAVTDFEFPVLRRSRAINPITEARQTSDWITDQLNEERRKRDEKLIVTMPVRQRELAAERRGSSLEQQVAQWSELVSLNNIKEVIEKLGYQVSRFSVKKNYISILRKTPDGKKKGRRIQFTLGSLLQVVQQLRTALKLSSDDEKIEQVIEEMEAQMRSDASRREIDRILLPKSRRKKSSKDDPDL